MLYIPTGVLGFLGFVLLLVGYKTLSKDILLVGGTGTTTITQKVPADQSSQFCPHCGAKLFQEAASCPNCNAPL